MKNLTIVESPAKARTISSFLGKDYKVIASKGHIRDLPKSTFGITIDDETGDLIPKYSIPRDANPTVKELKKLSKEAETIKESFMMPTSIQLTEFSAKSEKSIQNFLRTGSSKGIKSHFATKKTQGMNPAMLSMLLSTPDGRFTKPINAGDKWVVFRVEGKEGKKLLPYGEARNAVAGRWRQEQQAQALKDYFSKMRTEAKIRVIRK